MARTTVVTVTCDVCGRKVDLGTEAIVNARVYGVDMCNECLDGMSAVVLLNVLSLDEIHYENESGLGDKICYTMATKARTATYKENRKNAVQPR